AGPSTGTGARPAAARRTLQRTGPGDACRSWKTLRRPGPRHRRRAGLHQPPALGTGRPGGPHPARGQRPGACTGCSPRMNRLPPFSSTFSSTEEPSMSVRHAHTPLALALALALTAAGPIPALAQEVTSLTPITVSGDAQATPLNPGVQAERARLDGVAGGTNLIEPQKETRLVTLKDALDYQPGLVVQEFFGGLDQPRLNIRGSGIQSNPVNRGVLLMQDGLPLNEADGSFVIGFLEPRNARLISARRGANALSPAATTLGGELDFQSLTGTEGDLLRVEGGSFGRFGAQAAKGFRSGN